MTDAELIVAIRVPAALFFLTMTVAIALRQLDRVIRHRLFGRDSPRLLIRDLLFFWTLTIFLCAGAIAGAFGVVLADKLWWVLFSTLLGATTVSVWAYYEFVIIGRQK